MALAAYTGPSPHLSYACLLQHAAVHEGQLACLFSVIRNGSLAAETVQQSLLSTSHGWTTDLILWADMHGSPQENCYAQGLRTVAAGSACPTPLELGPITLSP